MRVATTVLQVDSTLTGENVAMTIDDAALSHIMAVLTDLYSDPEMAVLREYATNALDSHVEAGQRRPIDVTLPSQLSPFLKVRDYGVGLDADGIREIYSRYGTSTKRESDDVVGMLGLGCKSALTYADQFTLVGVRDGRSVTVLVSRDADGAGSMTIAEDCATDAPNGVEVVIPAKRVNQFERKAADFFRFWSPGSVLVDGKQPARVGGLWVSDDLLLSTEVDSDTVVMGNVPYPFTDDAMTSSWRRGRHSIVAFVPIGAVTFTPSRESLQATKRTAATLDDVKTRLARDLQASVQRQLTDAKTAPDAQAVLRQGQAVGFKGAAKWQGRDVLLAFDRTPVDVHGNRNRYADAREDSANAFLKVGFTYGKKSGDRSYDVPLADQLWFTGFDGKVMTSTKREKLETWLQGKGMPAQPCVMVANLTADEKFWLAADRVFDWSDVEAIKLASARSATNGNGKPRGSYDALVDDVLMTLQAADLDGDPRPLYWFNGNKYHARANAAVKAGVVSAAGAIIVALPANRVDKFCRDFPNAVNLDDAGKAQLARDVAALDPDDVEAYRVQAGSDVAALRHLDAGALLDPALQSACRLAARKTDAVAKVAARYRHWLAIDALTPLRRTPLAGYPLLVSLPAYGNLNPAVRDHATLYANAVFTRKADAGATS